MPNTGLGFPYPLLTDQPNGPAALQGLAQALDTFLRQTVGNGPSTQQDCTSVTTVASIAYPVVAGRNYEIRGTVNGSVITNSGIPTVKLLANGAELTRLATSTAYTVASGSSLPANCTSAWTYTATTTGTVTFSITAQCGAVVAGQSTAYRVPAGQAQLTIRNS